MAAESAESPTHAAAASSPGPFSLATSLASLAKLGRLSGLYLLLSSGLFYFTYKFYQPTFGGTDYFHYYKMYAAPLDLHAAKAPFVYRQLSAVLTNLVYEAAPFYDPQIFFQKSGYDQHIFFAALLTNYLAVGVCAAVIAMTTERLRPEGPPSVALLAGTLCYLQFFAQEYGLGPSTDGVAWLLMAIGFLGYVRRSLVTVVVVLGLSVVEREAIPIMLGAIAGANLLVSRDQRRFDAIVVALCVAAFAVYLAMRTLWAPVAGHEEQTQIALMVRGLARNLRSLMTKDVLFQGFVSQNLLILLALVVMWRAWRRRAPPLPARVGQLVIGLFAATAVIAVVGLATSLGGSVGHIIAMLTPVAAPLLAIAMLSEERAPALAVTSVAV